ncbi:hypothetical protein [Streptomyces sp. V4I2]|nr:hypothetical protein [Streptomyces sp. V4I2]
MTTDGQVYGMVCARSATHPDIAGGRRPGFGAGWSRRGRRFSWRLAVPSR